MSIISNLEVFQMTFVHNCFLGHSYGIKGILLWIKQESAKNKMGLMPNIEKDVPRLIL